MPFGARKPVPCSLRAPEALILGCSVSPDLADVRDEDLFLDVDMHRLQEELKREAESSSPAAASESEQTCTLKLCKRRIVGGPAARAPDTSFPAKRKGLWTFARSETSSLAYFLYRFSLGDC